MRTEPGTALPRIPRVGRGRSQAPVIAAVVVVIGVVAGVMASKGGRRPGPGFHTPKATLPELAAEGAAILRKRLPGLTADPAEPWAVAHGVLAFGKTRTLPGGARALPAIIKQHAVREDGRATFPDFVNGRPIAPHPGMFVKIAFEVDDPLAELKPEGLDRASLAKDALAERQADTLVNQEWLLEILFRTGSAGDEAARTAGEQVMTRLEQEQAYIEPYVKDQKHLLDAFDKKTREVDGRQVAAAIHAWYCGGNHLFQAATVAVARGFVKDGPKRLAKQLRILIFRARAESRYWERKLAQLDSATVSDSQRENLLAIFRSQQLKIVGHVLESWERILAEPCCPVTATDQAHTTEVAEDLGRLIKAIDEAGLFESVARSKDPRRKQLRQDLIGDACHALHGLELLAARAAR